MMMDLGSQNDKLTVNVAKMRLTTDNGGLPLMCCQHQYGYCCR